MLIKMSDFAKRQTKKSKYGHFSGTWEELELLVTQHFYNQKQGYRNGVVLVVVPPERFFTSIVKVDENTFFAPEFSARQEGEVPYLSFVSVGGRKMPAKSVEIALYHKDVLAENDENSTDADWEIVSINCSPFTGGVPLPPMTRARNNLRMVGGTDSKYAELSREELVELVRTMSEEIVFWSTHVLVGGER